MSTKKLAAWICLAALAPCLGACGPSVYMMSAQTGLKEVKNDWDDGQRRPPSGARIQGTVNVRLVAPTSVGCIVNAATAGQCNWFKVKAHGEDAEEAEMDGWYKVGGTAHAQLVRDFASSCRVILEHRLRQRFGQAQVYLGESSPAGALVVRVSGHHKAGNPHQSAVTLEAQIGGRTVKVQGLGSDRVHPGHLVWMISIVLGAGLLLGLPIMFSASQGMNKAALETAMMRAFDSAAVKLADEMVQSAEGAR